jgi:hypothetical protein
MCKLNVNRIMVLFTGQLDEKNEYREDIARLDDHRIHIYTRSNYRESWMFDVFSLDK